MRLTKESVGILGKLWKLFTRLQNRYSWSPAGFLHSNRMKHEDCAKANTQETRPGGNDDGFLHADRGDQKSSFTRGRFRLLCEEPCGFLIEGDGIHL